MKLMPPFRHRRDERDAKTSSPIAKEIRQTRRSVVLIRLQLRIRQHAYRYEEKSITQALICASQRIVRVIGREGKGAVIPHRSANGDDADCQQHARRNQLSLNQLRRDRSQKRNHQSAWTEHQSRIGRTISVKRLKNLRNQSGAAEQTESENKKENAGNGEITICKQ